MLLKRVDIKHVHSQGLHDCAAVLLEYGADLDTKNDLSQQNALMTAAFRGQYTCLKLLIEHDADIKATDLQGRTALILAALMGHHAAATALIQANAEINVQCKQGRTAYHWACVRGHAECAEILLEAGCKTDVRDMNGKLPSDLALNPEVREVQDRFVQRQKEREALAAEKELLAQLEQESRDKQHSESRKARKRKKKKKKKDKKKKEDMFQQQGRVTVVVDHCSESAVKLQEATDTELECSGRVNTLDVVAPHNRNNGIVEEPVGGSCAESDGTQPSASSPEAHRDYCSEAVPHGEFDERNGQLAKEIEDVRAKLLDESRARMKVIRDFKRMERTMKEQQGDFNSQLEEILADNSEYKKRSERKHGSRSSEMIHLSLMHVIVGLQQELAQVKAEARQDRGRYESALKKVAELERAAGVPRCRERNAVRNPKDFHIPTVGHRIQELHAENEIVSERTNRILTNLHELVNIWVRRTTSVRYPDASE
eukprot:SAG11_NODE_172_length_13574_cov_14.732690_3_plen_485_part_00